MGARIRVTLEGTRAYCDLKTNFHYDIQFLTVDEAFFPEYLSHEYADWLYTPQLARMAGPALMPRKVITAARRQAAQRARRRPSRRPDGTRGTPACALPRRENRVRRDQAPTAG
jgi:hypothetical protein